MEQAVRARRAGGFTLVEIMIALAVVSVALLGLLSLINSSGLVQEDTRYRTIAYNAAREKIEEMRSTALDTVYTVYKFGAAVPNPGNTFSVDGLPEYLIGGVAQPQGTIYFPENSPGSGLAETLDKNDLLSLELGLPKDLNRNGTSTDSVADGTMTETNYNLLPVKVVISWTAIGGKTISLPVVTYLTQR